MEHKCKSLHRLYLERKGFVSTRSGSLDNAIKDIHYALCMLDEQQLKVAEELLSSPLRDIVNKFASIEQLKKDF